MANLADKIFDVLNTDQWQSTTDIAKKAGVTKGQAASTIYALRETKHLVSRRIAGGGGEMEHLGLRKKRVVTTTIRPHTKKKAEGLSKRLADLAVDLDELVNEVRLIEEQLDDVRASLSRK